MKSALAVAKQCNISIYNLKSKIHFYWSHAPNTTGVVDLTMKCLLTSPQPTMQFKKTNNKRQKQQVIKVQQ
jgi:hypothetical protein